MRSPRTARAKTEGMRCPVHGAKPVISAELDAETQSESSDPGNMPGNIRVEACCPEFEAAVAAALEKAYVEDRRD